MFKILLRSGIRVLGWGKLWHKGLTEIDFTMNFKSKCWVGSRFGLCFLALPFLVPHRQPPRAGATPALHTGREKIPDWFSLGAFVNVWLSVPLRLLTPQTVTSLCILGWTVMLKRVLSYTQICLFFFFKVKLSSLWVSRSPKMKGEEKGEKCEREAWCPRKKGLRVRWPRVWILVLLPFYRWKYSSQAHRVDGELSQVIHEKVPSV